MWSRDPGHAPFYPLLTFRGWHPQHVVLTTNAITGPQTMSEKCFNTHWNHDVGANLG